MVAEHPTAVVLKNHIFIVEQTSDELYLSIKNKGKTKWKVLCLNEDEDESIYLERQIKANKIQFHSEARYWHYIVSGDVAPP